MNWASVDLLSYYLRLFSAIENPNHDVTSKLLYFRGWVYRNADWEDFVCILLSNVSKEIHYYYYYYVTFCFNHFCASLNLWINVENLQNVGLFLYTAVQWKNSVIAKTWNWEKHARIFSLASDGCFPSDHNAVDSTDYNTFIYIQPFGSGSAYSSYEGIVF